MEQTRLGPNDIPAGDPGFMIAIEVDRPLSDLTPEWRTDPATALHDTVEDQPRALVSILDESQLSDGSNQQAALDLITKHFNPETSDAAL
ncbi:hypothetical protein E5720_16540 [Rhodococcus sp. PAMC28707]|uniref:hypothetical protein n=1 Tax=unclassified Rhodococcus (in: high G+C Gram-positive bacteria) TaxID=192944 RepID=UPI00109DF800|nr:MULTISPECIES: hypothetical protein [unclassified Rhodococcus (in: high G+C Gram-positive bacteria)]QCB51968.1 hypothetical protein E5769_18980 [Rhodococcus sp. PAMC28705]QCB59862.1 hypothetical protein E5720_16540 [Rhodococcus sp. PAMC28707]